MKGCQSAEDFYTRWDCNNYGCGCEVCACVNIYSYGEHVVSPNNKSQETNCYYRSDHAHITKGLFLTGIVSYDMGNYSEPGENKNVYLWVAEEPEKVLIEDGVSTPCGVEKSGI